MTHLLEENDPQKPLLTGSEAAPAPVPPEHEQKQRRGFFRIIGAILGLIRDYTAEDLSRFKEARIRIEEAKADRIVAEAEKLHAQADLTKQQAALQEAEAQFKKAEATERMASVTQRIRDLKRAIGVIRMKGGSILFDSEELLEIFMRGLLENPDDEIIQTQEKNLLELADQDEDVTSA